jgi:hypothetical protein
VERIDGSFTGVTDEQFNAEGAPGQRTYRAAAKHVLALEHDSLETTGCGPSGAGTQLGSAP